MYIEKYWEKCYKGIFTSEPLHSRSLFSVLANLVIMSDIFSLSCSRYIGSHNFENSSCNLSNLSLIILRRGITSVKVSYK